jgi:hypothetical protein
LPVHARWTHPRAPRARVFPTGRPENSRIGVRTPHTQSIRVTLVHARQSARFSARRGQSRR